MKSAELLRKLKKLAKRNGVPLTVTPAKGSHWKVYYGAAHTVVPAPLRTENRSAQSHSERPGNFRKGTVVKTKVLSYSAMFTPEKEGGFSVSFPDFPEAHSQGDDVEEAFHMAIDCLNAAIEWRLEEKREIPLPGRARRGQYAIPVSLDLAPKLALYQVMRERGVSNVKLAKQLGVSELIVRRMLNPKHKSKPEQYTRALQALGQTLEVSVIGGNRVIA